MKEILRQPILLLIIVIITLNSANSEFCDGNTFTLSGRGNQLIHVAKGTQFNIKIPGNPTTGYVYYLANRNEINTNAVEPVNLTTNGSTEYQSNPTHGMVGVGGNYCFRFLAKEDIENLPLAFEYKRSWEPRAIESQVALVTVS